MALYFIAFSCANDSLKPLRECHLKIVSRSIRTCPYVGCDFADEDGTTAESCHACGRELLYCPACNTGNRVFYQYCRCCGAVPGMKQDSKASNSLEILGERVDHLPLEWSREFEGIPESDDSSKRESLPGPIVAGDLVIAYNSMNSAFEAFSTRNGKLIWTSPTFREVLTYSSTPVVSGAYMYFVVTSPNYLQRIALGSGLRESCAVRTEDELYHEMPGSIKQDCPLTSIKLHTESMFDEELPDACLVTSNGIMFLEFSPEVESRTCVLKGKFEPGNFQSMESNRPTTFGRYIVVTSKTAPKILLIDCAAYPEKIEIQFIPTSQTASDMKNSPAVPLHSLESGTEPVGVCWSSYDDAASESTLMRFYPPDTFEPFKIPYLEESWRRRQYETGPLSYGSMMCLTGRNKQGDFGFARVYKDRYEIKMINQHFSIENCQFLDGETLLIAFENRVSLVNPHAAEINFVDKTPYPTATCLPVARPLVARDHVFVQTSLGLICYRIKRKREST